MTAGRSAATIVNSLDEGRIQDRCYCWRKALISPIGDPLEWLEPRHSTEARCLAPHTRPEAWKSLYLARDPLQITPQHGQYRQNLGLHTRALSQRLVSSQVQTVWR